jgi:aminoglycoside 6'-N-acetyltransferase I
VAEAAGGVLVGFLEAGLRSYVDSCDPIRPVGYVEGWYVIEAHRREGIGAQLLRAAEEWARAQGSTEMASDCDIENIISQRTHEALGFQVTSRSVNFRKMLLKQTATKVPCD